MATRHPGPPAHAANRRPAPKRRAPGTERSKGSCMKAITFAGLGLAALLLGSTAASAKTLVYCSEGSPENFTPAINTTGTSFDAARPVYNRLTEFKRGTTIVGPGLAESWDVSDGGKTIVFHLRKGVKFHSVKDFKPTRDFNADDVLFSFNRQWKPDNPYAKVSGGKYDYFNDMDMPALLESIEKKDDYTVVMKLKTPNVADPRQSGDGFRLDRLGRIRRFPAEERHARAIRPGAGRHRPVLLRRLPEGRGHPLQGEQGLFRREAAGRRPRLRHHARRDGALRQAEGRRVPYQRLSATRRSAGNAEGPDAEGDQRSPASTSRSGRSTRPSRRSTRRKCARRSPWRSTRRRSSRTSISAPASRPRR